MCDSFHNPAELRYLWKQRGNKNYILKNFNLNGSFIRSLVFEDSQNGHKVLGKIVTLPREGEAYHWPRLQHENLVPLLDIVSINEMISIYIHPFIGQSLKHIIHDAVFLSDPNCFDRKKAYVEDILWALDYLHDKSLCLMNFTDAIIHVCEVSDKAVICDFSCATLAERVTKDRVEVPILFRAPEMGTHQYFNSTASEMWIFGVIVLQIFTKHVLPFSFVGDEVNQVLKAVKDIDYKIIKETNPAANLDYQAVEDLKEFLGLFLVKNPVLRINAKNAAIAPFLTKSKLRFTVVNKYSRKFKEPDKSFGYCSYQANSKKTLDDIKNNLIFKDIYLNEAAKCRDKLKKLPRSNTLINLNFLKESDSSKNLDGKSRRNSTCIISKDLRTIQMPIEDQKCTVSKNTVMVSNEVRGEDKKMLNSLPDQPFDLSNLKERCSTINGISSQHYKQEGNSHKSEVLNNLNQSEMVGSCNMNYNKNCVENSPSLLNVSLDSLEDPIPSNLGSETLHSNAYNNSKESTSIQSFDSKNNKPQELDASSKIGTSPNIKHYAANEINDKSKFLEMFHSSTTDTPTTSFIRNQSENNSSINSQQDSTISFKSFDRTTLNLNTQIDNLQKTPIFDCNHITDSSKVHFHDDFQHSSEFANLQDPTSINTSTKSINNYGSNSKEQFQHTNNIDSKEKSNLSEKTDEVPDSEDNGDCANQISDRISVTKRKGAIKDNITINRSIAQKHVCEVSMVPKARSKTDIDKTYDQQSNTSKYIVKLESTEELGGQQYPTYKENDHVEYHSQDTKCINTTKDDSGNHASGDQIKDTFTNPQLGKHAKLLEMGKISNQHSSMGSCEMKLELTKSTEQHSKEINSKTCLGNANGQRQVYKCVNTTKDDSESSQNDAEVADIFAYTHSEEQATLTGMEKSSMMDKHEKYSNMESYIKKLDSTKSTAQQVKKTNSKAKEDNMDYESAKTKYTDKTKNDSTKFQSDVQINLKFTQEQPEQQLILLKIENDSYKAKHQDEHSNVLSCTVKTASMKDKDNEKRTCYTENNNVENPSQVTKSINSEKNHSGNSKSCVQINGSFVKMHSETQVVLPDIKENWNEEDYHDDYSNTSSHTEDVALSTEEVKSSHSIICDKYYSGSPSQIFKCTNTTISDSSILQMNDGLSSTNVVEQANLKEIKNYSVENHSKLHINMPQCTTKTETIEEQDTEPISKENGGVGKIYEVYTFLNMIETDLGNSGDDQINADHTSRHYKDHAILIDKKFESHIEMQQIIVADTVEDASIKCSTGENNIDYLCHSSTFGDAIEKGSKSACDVLTDNSFTLTHPNQQVLSLKVSDDHEHHDQHSNLCNDTVKVEPVDERSIETFPKSYKEGDSTKNLNHASKCTNTAVSSACSQTTTQSDCFIHSSEQATVQEIKDLKEGENSKLHLNLNNFELKATSAKEQYDIKMYSKTCEESDKIKYPFKILKVTKSINTMESNSVGFETPGEIFNRFSQAHSCEQFVLPETKCNLRIQETDDKTHTYTVKLEPAEEQDMKPYLNTCGENCNVEYQNLVPTDMMENYPEGSHNVTRKNSSFVRNNSYRKAMLRGMANLDQQQTKTEREANGLTSKEKFISINLLDENYADNIDDKWKIYRNISNKEDQMDISNKSTVSSAETPILNISSTTPYSGTNLIKNSVSPGKRMSRSFFRSIWLPFLCLGKKKRKSK